MRPPLVLGDDMEVDVNEALVLKCLSMCDLQTVPVEEMFAEVADDVALRLQMLGEVLGVCSTTMSKNAMMFQQTKMMQGQ